MTHEPVTLGAHFADGLGGEPVRGDVAVDAGTITAGKGMRRHRG